MSFFSAIFGTFITDPEGEGRRGNSLAWPCIEQLSKQLKNEWMNGAQLRLGLPSCTPLPPPPLPPSLCLCWTVRDGGAASWLYAARKWLAHMLVQPSKANPACCFSLSCCCWATCANACPRNVGVEVILGHNIPATYNVPPWPQARMSCFHLRTGFNYSGTTWIKQHYIQQQQLILFRPP